MNPEELEALITEAIGNAENPALLTEKLNDIRQGFNTVLSDKKDIQTKYDDTHSKYFEALEANGRLNSQLSYQRDEDPDEPDEPEKPKKINELFKPEFLQN